MKGEHQMEKLEKELNERLNQIPAYILSWQRGEVANDELGTALQECKLLMDEYILLSER
jgi:hypothetical protein